MLGAPIAPMTPVSISFSMLFPSDSPLLGLGTRAGTGEVEKKMEAMTGLPVESA